MSSGREAGRRGMTLFTTSADGTSIAYERTGSGPVLVVVDGALCSRALGPARGIAKALAHAFTVVIYDRRGRGESGDTPPWSVEREVEDVAAVIQATGGRARLFGSSSGAALSLEAAARLDGVEGAVLYEAPFIVDDTREPIDPGFPDRVADLVARNRRGEAVRAFLTAVGMPAAVARLMAITPMWKRMKGVAPTLPNDLRIIGPHQGGQPLPTGRYDDVRVPALVLAGAKSPDWMRNAQAALAAALPEAEHQVLPGQTHMIKAKAVGPVIEAWATRTAVPLTA
jgi:pimeloyl-ACP methyl ester carboxylesterase